MKTPPIAIVIRTKNSVVQPHCTSKGKAHSHLSFSYHHHIEMEEQLSAVMLSLETLPAQTSKTSFHSFQTSSKKGRTINYKCVPRSQLPKHPVQNKS